MSEKRHGKQTEVCELFLFIWCHGEVDQNPLPNNAECFAGERFCCQSDQVFL
ncbi:hypothetical protein D3C80_1942120 [compost metagenome]